MTALEHAIARLHSEGYQASPSPLFAGWITVLDPAHCRRGSEPMRIEYERTQLHPSAVERFLIDRA